MLRTPSGLLLLLFVGSANSSFGQCERAEEQRFSASDSEWNDEFGFAVSTSGGVAVVGAPKDADRGDRSGSAYVFRFDGSAWQQEQKLFDSNGEAVDLFGFAVAVSGDVIVVGAPGRDIRGREDAGRAYVFRYDGSRWNLEQRLRADDAAPDDEFGESVAVSGDVIAVGKRLDDELGDNAGAAYMFRFDGNRWSREQKLTATDGAAQDGFGSSVSLSGDTALVGVPGQDPGGVLSAGSAYVFRYDGVSWREVRKLVASIPRGDAWLGAAVSVQETPDGYRALLGAPLDSSDRAQRAGTCYLFEDVRGVLSEHLLSATRGENFDLFGISVALDNDLALIGAPAADSTSEEFSGAAYVFRHDESSGEWLEEQWPTASDAASGDAFGNSVSLDGTTAMIGAHEDYVGTVNSGSCYAFEILELALEVNQDVARAGDLLIFSTLPGRAGNPVLLAVVDVNGVPLFVLVAVSAFVECKWTYRATVPPGLVGVVVGFQSFGVARSGSATESNREAVTFQ